MAFSHTRFRARLAALATVVAVAVVAMLTGAGLSHAAQVLREGHTDFVNVRVDKSGNLVLEVKEDITGHNVLRQPEDVELVVGEKAKRPLEGDFAQFGTTGWVLPLTQQPGLLWPGFDTMAVQGHGFSAIDINFTDVSGPGKIYLATQAGSFGGGLKPLLTDGFEVRSGSVRRQDPPAHTHAYWVFTAPGTYTMEVVATGSGKTSNTGRYTWIVEGEADETGGSTPTTEKAPDDKDESGNDGDGGKDKNKKTTTTASSTAKSTSASKPYFDPLNDPWLNTPVETKREPTRQTNRSRDTGSAGSSGSSMFGSSGTDDYAPTAPVAKAPATQAPSATDRLAEGERSDEKSSGTGSCTPVQKTSSAPKLLPAIRDDRQSPARMVDPESLVFHLGEKSTATTTVDVGSIPSGTPVHMIGATQVDGVPWLGANTMNPELLESTTGDVTWTLTGFDGPGRMEVFTSGNFGQIVGDRWFSAAPGSPSGHVVIGRNTHVHPNWVFDTPGTYRVTITQTTRTTAGAQLSAPTTLTFTVGEGRGVTSGHFDLGARLGTTTATDTQFVDDNGRPCDPQSGIRVAGETTETTAASGTTGSHTGGTTGTNHSRSATVMANTGIDPMVAALLFVAVAFGCLGLALVSRGRVK